MWYLCQHPDVERKLAAEVAAVMGTNGQPSYQQLSEMRYLNAVLKARAWVFCGDGLVLVVHCAAAKHLITGSWVIVVCSYRGSQLHRQLWPSATSQMSSLTAVVSRP
jgi:hypothetical protein